MMGNSDVPLHNFLSPFTSSDLETFKTLCFVGTKPNDVDMSSQFLWIRVSALSLRLLNLAMAVVHLDAERDWNGQDIVASSLQYVLEQEEWRDKMVWQPKEWYNGTGAMFEQPWRRNGVERLLGMEEVLESQESVDKAREVYPSAKEVKTFWDTVMEAKRVLGEARDRGHTSEEGEFAEEARALKDWVELRSWDVPGLRERLEILKAQLGIGEIIGYEIGIG
jgi:hypothetical protein